MANVPRTDITVKEYLDSIDDEQTVKDSETLIAMMKKISGKDPVIWNVGTIGFDTYHYKYDSGREGDCHAIGFYPRKGKLTLYFMDGTTRYPELLEKLGKYTSSTACIYIKRLSDVDLKVLEQMAQKSYQYVKDLDGHMHRM